MVDFHNERIKGLIIAVAWVLVWVPVVVPAAEQRFVGIQSIAFGAQPVALTLKTERRTDIEVSVDSKYLLALYAEWIVRPDGTLQFQSNQSEVSASAIPVTVTVPEGWAGQLRCIGSGHRLRGQNLNLKRLQVELVGGGMEVDWSGNVDQLQADVTGTVQWRAMDLKVGTLVWNGVGEGDVRVRASEQLSGQLVGRFTLEYGDKPRILSMNSLGQSKVSPAHATP